MPGIFDPYHRWLGIPLKDQPPNHYRLLGIELFEADLEVIRDAAEQRIAHVRTYQLGRYSALSQKILNELAAAKACLLDPKKKAAYDRQLPNTPSNASQASNRVVSPPPMPRPPQLFKRPASHSKLAWLLPVATAAAALLVVAAVAAFMHATPPLPVPKSATATQREASEATNTGKPADLGREEEPAGPQSAQAPSAHSPTTSLTSKRAPAGFENAQAESKPPHTLDAPNADIEPTKCPTKVRDTDSSWGVRIAVDTYHNDSGREILRCAANHPIAVSDSQWSAIQKPLCQESLHGCDILVVANAGRLKSYGSKEYDAVARFVYDGGGLLITGAARGGVPEGSDLEQIGVPFGLLMTAGTCSGNAAQFSSHPIAWGLAGLSWPKNAATNSYITLSSGAVPVVYDATHRTVCAVASPGRGRVCMMSPLFITWGCDPRFPQYGRLLRRVCHWLAKRDEAGHEAPFDGSVAKPDGPKKRRGFPSGSEEEYGTSSAVDLKLPSGAALTESKLEMPGKWEDKLYPEGLSIYRAEYPGGSTRALVTISEAAKNKGKFHGWVATLHANGRLQTLAQYKDGELDGPRKRWAEDGTRLFYAEYKRGKKDGVLCLFQKGRPWWIEEWKWQTQKAPQNEYLVKVASDGVRIVLPNQLTSDEKEEMQKARQEAINAQRELTNSETQLKQETRKKFAEELERRKHKELTKQAPARLQRQLDRTRQHAQERDAGFEKARSRANPANWGRE